MRNYRLFLLLFGIVSSAFAQDYRIINPARDYYYGDMNRVIHIDSVAEENGDSLYFNYTLDLLCDRGTPVLPRWFSQPVSVNAQGEYTFRNRQGEPILIHSQSQPGTHWIGYTYPNGQFLQATHTNTLWDSIPHLGVMDSLKRITFRLRSTSGAFLNSPWNTEEIYLSKQYGLIRIYPFDHFPDSIQSYSIVGISNPDLGKPGMSTQDFYDFQVGDEWQVFRRFFLRDYGVREYMTHKVIAKQQLADTIRYQIQRTDFDIDYSAVTSDTSWSSQIYNLQVVLSGTNQVPLQVANTDYTYSWYQQSAYAGKNMRLTLPVSFGYIDTLDCWQPDYDAFPTFCLEGLACGYYSIGYGSYLDERLPIYFNQNGEEWGNRYRFERFITSNDPREDALALRLYPNPVSEVLHLEFMNGTAGKLARLELYDALGRLHLQTELPAIGDQEIAVHQLQPGMYLYRLATDGGTFSSGKILKQ